MGFYKLENYLNGMQSKKYMLSETICNKLVMDEEFNHTVKHTAIAERDHIAQSSAKRKAVLNRAYHNLHGSAFELSVLFSPRAAKKPSSIGEFLVTLLSISRLGKVYLGNMLNLMNTMKSKSPFKRIDKLKIGLMNTIELLDDIDGKVQKSLEDYLQGRFLDDKSKISKYSKSMLKVRRSYYKVKFKIKLLNDCFDFSSIEYRTYAPLMQFVRFHANPSSISMPNSVVLDAVANKPKSKRKEAVDKENTAFILKHGLPRKLAVRKRKPVSAKI